MSNTQIITFQKTKNTCVHSIYQLYSFTAGGTGMSFRAHCPSPPLDSVLSVGCVQSGTQKNISHVFPLEEQDGVVPQPPDAPLWSRGHLFLILDSQSGWFGWSHLPWSFAEAGHRKALDLWTNCLQEVYTQCPVSWCCPAAFRFLWSLAASSALLLRCMGRHIRRNFLHDMTAFYKSHIYMYINK